MKIGITDLRVPRPRRTRGTDCTLNLAKAPRGVRLLTPLVPRRCDSFPGAPFHEKKIGAGIRRWP